MGRSSNRRTWIVRITSELSYGALATGLETLGDVEHMQLKDGSIANPNGALPVKGNMDLLKPKYRTYSPEGKASIQAAMLRQGQLRHKLAVDTFTGILRENAHAPMIKLVTLMNQTEARPSRKKFLLWNEGTLAKILDEALANITAPGAPAPRG